jgi:LysR family carnitine catabolism transcriptional activator
MINIKHLKAYIAVASELHFTRAADKICLTQPALSSLIQQLEHELGVSLISRHTRQVELTEAGKEFKLTAEKLVTDFEQALYDVRTYKSMRRGRLSIAALPSVCSSILPSVLAKFNSEYPDIKINIMDCTGQEILDALNDKRVDFAISYTQSDKELEAMPLMKDALMVVCHRKHVFAAQKEVSWLQLVDERVIAMEKGTTIRTLIDSNALAKDIKLDIILEPRMMPTALAYTEAGIGISILPSSGVSQNLSRDLLVLPLVEPRIERGIAILRRRDRAITPAAKIFQQYLQQHLAMSVD